MMRFSDTFTVVLRLCSKVGSVQGGSAAECNSARDCVAQNRKAILAEPPALFIRTFVLDKCKNIV